MSYRDLYESVQDLEPHIKRTVIRDKVRQLKGFNKVTVVATGIDISVGRGYYISAQNEDHPLRHVVGCPFVMIARGMNRCWQRFVETKEWMHAFDTAEQATDTGQAFDDLLNEFSGHVPGARSAAYTAEIDAFYKALGTLCPERVRQEFARDREKSLEDDYSIALKLRIPEQYVPFLFKPFYRDLVDSYLQ